MTTSLSVLVTGGTGFVGYWMRQMLPKGLTAYWCNRDTYEHLDWGVWYGAYVHLANIAPTRVLDAALNHKARVLYASSGAVYDRETDYANDKRCWEKECSTSGANVVIARLFTFFGERLDGNKAVVQFVRAARDGTPIIIHGDGDTVRSYMHGAEMGREMWAILLHGRSGEAYDVGSSKPYTMLELARLVNRSFGNRSAIVIENRAEECTYYMPRDTAKTRGLL